MSTLIAYRKASRSPHVGLGGKDLSGTKSTWVNLENPRARRDLARHISIGQVVETQAARFQNDTAQVESGGVVTPRTGSLTVDISALSLKYVAGTDAVYTKDAVVSAAALTQAITPSATLPQLTAIGLNTSTPATPTAVALNGTAAAIVLEERAVNAVGGLPAANVPAVDSTADRTWLALVWVPPALASVTGVATTGVVTKAAHGYKVGDPVWFSAVTGASAGITTATVYYVKSVPTTGTFTLSATEGGPLLTWTGDLTAAVVQRQILASDVVDVRP
jgi:hypothetical protein